HEPHLALIGHRRNQRQALAACRNLDDRRLAAGRVAAVPALVTANASLVTPADLCLFPFRARDNLRILTLQPELYCLIVAFIRPSRRLLRCVAPTRQILADSANRQPYAKTHTNQLPDRSTRPQRKRQLQLIRKFPADQILCRALVLRRQSPLRPFRPATARQNLEPFRLVAQFLQKRRAVCPRIPRDRTDLDHRLAHCSQLDKLSAKLQTSIRAGSTTVFANHQST